MENLCANILILGPPQSRFAWSPLYRGTCRGHPTYCDAVPSDHEINRLFMWYLEEGGESGVVHDRAKAARFTNLQNSLVPQGLFELVEVADETASSVLGGQRLGFDISLGYNTSLIAMGLKPRANDESSKPSRILGALIAKVFSRQLNEHGLFSAAEVAEECLAAMDALNELRPSTYEGCRLLGAFRVIGLFEIPNALG